MERECPVAGEIYRHFKNKLYQIVGVAVHSESKEKLVIYQALYDDFGMYARPYDMFMSEVDRVKYPDVVQKYRFEKVGRAGDRVSEETDVTDNASEEANKKSVQTVDNVVQAEESVDEEEAPNADLMAFLDAETYEEKRSLLVAMRPRITDRLINDMAAALDISVEEGDLDERFKSLLYCVSKFDEYEITRLR